jgi:K+-transporting ATPase KdpF subunit
MFLDLHLKKTLELNESRRVFHGRPGTRHLLRLFARILFSNQLVREIEESPEMNWLYMIGGVVVLGLFIYLGVALFKPEVFE